MNPFTLMFGITTSSKISRSENIEKIQNAFLNENGMYSYLITGIRGTGKTVLLRTLEEIIEKTPNWIVLKINPQKNIISEIYDCLIQRDYMANEASKCNLSLNLGQPPLIGEDDKNNNPEIVIANILEKLKTFGLKILITIDEVNNTSEFKKFINYYQIIISKRLPMYLLMTASNENAIDLINDKASAFLTRIPKIVLEPLDLNIIASEYQSKLNVSLKTSIELAKLTNGYAFAYQVLGYLFYESGAKEITTDSISKYEKYLWNNGYAKFWKDLSNKDREFLIALSKTTNGIKKDILDYLESKDSYPVYRERLLEKGLIYSPSYGCLNFVLPRFKEFIQLMLEFE